MRSSGPNARPSREIEAGDHAILLARLESGGAGADGLPLVYFNRHFGTWIGEAQHE